MTMGSSGGGQGKRGSEDDAAPSHGLELPPLPSVRNRDGSVNLEYFRAKSDRVYRINEHWLVRTGKPVNTESQLKALRQEAKLYGVDLADLEDTRSPQQRIEDCITRFLSSPGSASTDKDEATGVDALLEQSDDDLRLMEKSCEDAVEKCKAQMETHREVAEAQAQEARALMRRGKSSAG